MKINRIIPSLLLAALLSGSFAACKVSRDPQSTEMLDLIFNNRVYDAGEIYSIGSIADQLYSASQGSSIGLATLLARNEKLMNRMLEKNFVEKLKKLAEAAGKG